MVLGGIEDEQKTEFAENYSKHVPMGRMMNRNELIGLIEYLCSDKSTYTTGSIITVDGGWTIW